MTFINFLCRWTLLTIRFIKLFFKIMLLFSKYFEEIKCLHRKIKLERHLVFFEFILSSYSNYHFGFNVFKKEKIVVFKRFHNGNTFLFCRFFLRKVEAVDLLIYLFLCCYQMWIKHLMFQYFTGGMFLCRFQS